MNKRKNNVPKLDRCEIPDADINVYDKKMAVSNKFSPFS